MEERVQLPGAGTDRVLMKPGEVAALLRLSKMTVYRMVQEGQLHGVRFGRSLRISRESVKALMGDTWPGTE